MPICARLWIGCRNYYRKFLNFSTNLGILFSSKMENNNIKYIHFDHSTPIVCDLMHAKLIIFVSMLHLNVTNGENVTFRKGFIHIRGKQAHVDRDHAQEKAFE